MYHSNNGKRTVLKQYFKDYFILCCRGMGDLVDPNSTSGPSRDIDGLEGVQGRVLVMTWELHSCLQGAAVEQRLCSLEK